MKRLYQCRDIIEAQTLSDLLTSHRIRNHIFNANAIGGTGEIPFVETYPEIWIEEEEQREKASALIDEYEQTNTDGDDQVCPYCNERNPANFDFCWKCKSELKPMS